MSPEVFIWEDPPPEIKRTKWLEVVERLRERPNTWARVWSPDEDTREGKAYQVAQSLRRHPNVESIVRDRKHVYARAIVAPARPSGQRPKVAEDE